MIKKYGNEFIKWIFTSDIMSYKLKREAIFATN
jgi:hypothetical protein